MVIDNNLITSRSYPKGTRQEVTSNLITKRSREVTSKKAGMAWTQIFLLVIGIFAFAFALGGGIGFVSAEEFPEGYTPPPIEDPLPIIPNFGNYNPDTYSEYLIENPRDGSYIVDDGGVEDDPKLGSDFLKLLQNALIGEGVTIVKNGIMKKIKRDVGGEIVDVATNGGEVAKESTWFKDLLANQALQGIAYSWVAYAMVRWATSYGSERNADFVNKAAGLAATGASAIGVYFLLAAAAGPAGWVYGLFVAGVSLLTALFTWQIYSKEVISYQVGTWQPTDGGRWCGMCNKIPTGCSEYQCRTFGKGCSLINEGTTEEKCVWEFQDDRIPPIIFPLRGILKDGLTFEEFNISSPPERGMRIVDTSNEDKCVPAFSSLTVGVQTDEYAICRWDYERKENFDEMAFYMDEGSPATKNHTIFIPNSATASQESLENVGVVIGGEREYGFFIKCKDIHGGENPLHFLVEFCVESGPDLDAPEIFGTNYLPGSYIQFNASSLPLQVYTNEPADCKWDHDNLEYGDMNYNMSGCSQNTEDYFSGFSYGCSGNLTGFQDRQENKFYIRCKDKPWWEEGDEGRRYENRESHELILKGTESLFINSFTVNGEESGATIKGTAEEIKVVLEVTASAGAELGKAKCSYLSGGNYYNFYNEGNNDYVQTNKQRLWLVPGEYSYNVSCIDIGGNIDNEFISFSVESDNLAPIVVRAFHESSSLKIITNEESSCVYSDSVDIGCDYSYDDGESMNKVGDSIHYASWNTNVNYYIKCEDEFGNRPLPNQCSITVRPMEI